MPLVTRGGAVAGTIFGVDVASYQGNPSWSAVFKAGIRFGFSKVTESTTYTNPTWSHNRPGMLALGDDFLPGAYHFLHGGNGAAQARFFLAKAGDVSKMAVALDVEASGADAATSRAWVAEFKRLTGGHPVIGYYPRWYWEQTGRPDLSFFDTVWQSHYVTGSGTPAFLYGRVPSSWWAAFGGEPISILQYSSSGSVSGIPGQCDVNAYRGSLSQLRAIALGKDDDMPLTSDDAERVADLTVKRLLAAVYNRRGHTVGTALETAHDGVLALLARNPDEVDEGAVAAAVLAGLTPASIAAAVVGVLPADLAQQVVDEIQSRLAA